MISAVLLFLISNPQILQTQKSKASWFLRRNPRTQLNVQEVLGNYQKLKVLKRDPLESVEDICTIISNKTSNNILCWQIVIVVQLSNYLELGQKDLHIDNPSLNHQARTRITKPVVDSLITDICHPRQLTVKISQLCWSISNRLILTQIMEMVLTS